jgi:hypothetical protein
LLQDGREAGIIGLDGQLSGGKVNFGRLCRLIQERRR